MRERGKVDEITRGGWMRKEEGEKRRRIRK